MATVAHVAMATVVNNMHMHYMCILHMILKLMNMYMYLCLDACALIRRGRMVGWEGSNRLANRMSVGMSSLGRRVVR